MSRYTIRISQPIDARLAQIAERSGISKAEAMRRAFALLAVEDEEIAKGNTLVILNPKDNPVAELVGLSDRDRGRSRSSRSQAGQETSCHQT